MASSLFVRSRRVVAGLAAAAALAAGACARSAPASERERAADGAQIFQQACAKCHAADGSGGLPMAANGPRPIDLRSPEWQRSRSDDEIVTTIRTGRGAMPPFGDVLKPDAIGAVAAHVRSLRTP